MREDSAIDTTVLDEFREPDGSASDFLRALVAQYLAESAALVTEMRDALEQQHVPALGRAAHRLKGSSATVGAIRVARLCGEIEALARSATLSGAPGLLHLLGIEAAYAAENLLRDDPDRTRLGPTDSITVRR